MLHYFNERLFTILLATIYFCSVTSVAKHSGCAHNKCTELDFENCKNKNCNCSNETEERIIVCYFTNWAWYRSGIAKYTPDNIDPSLCTHINYAFASLDSQNHTIQPSDSWADIDNGFYKLVTSLMQKGVKVMISIGGWNNSAVKFGWSYMMGNKTARAIFINSVINFLETYQFHGLDLDLEYPGCPQGNSSDGKPGDAQNFNKLVKELKAAFSEKYFVSVTISAGKENLEKCYDVRGLCNIPHWTNVMAYDYHSYSEGVVGANAPTCGTGSSWGVYETLHYLTKVAKCPAKKLVLGIPLYGQSYTLQNNSCHKWGVNASGPGLPGNYTQNSGTLSYYEICLKQKNGWKTGWSKPNGSFAWDDTQMVSFDNIDVIKSKCCLINKHFGLKGAMIWTLDYDDFTGACGCGKYPLLKTLNQQLRCLNQSCIECY